MRCMVDTATFADDVVVVVALIFMVVVAGVVIAVVGAVIAFILIVVGLFLLPLMLFLLFPFFLCLLSSLMSTDRSCLHGGSDSGRRSGGSV